MIGFDNFLPSKWLDGVLAIHVSTPVVRKKAVVSRNGGKWFAGSMAAALTFASAVTSVGLMIQPAYTTQAGSDVVNPGDLKPDLAPAGYIDKLMAAMSRTALLPVQSTEYDPPALV